MVYVPRYVYVPYVFFLIFVSFFELLYSYNNITIQDQGGKKIMVLVHLFLHSAGSHTTVEL